MKVFENKFDQVVEKSLDFVLCLFGFVEAKKFRDSRERAKRPRSFALQCYTGLVRKQRFSLVA